MNSTTTDRLLIVGRTMTGLFAAFMLVASVAPKLLAASPATDALVAVGWPPGHALLVGLIELALLVLHLVPRTAVLGAVLMTGLLGAAVAAHLRVGSPLATHTMFGIYLGSLMWGGLCLRVPAVRQWLLGSNAAASRPMGNPSHSG